jgi:hypothetical protein
VGGDGSAAAAREKPSPLARTCASSECLFSHLPGVDFLHLFPRSKAQLQTVARMDQPAADSPSALPSVPIIDPLLPAAGSPDAAAATLLPAEDAAQVLCMGNSANPLACTLTHRRRDDAGAALGEGMGASHAPPLHLRLQAEVLRPLRDPAAIYYFYYFYFY